MDRGASARSVYTLLWLSISLLTTSIAHATLPVPAAAQSWSYYQTVSPTLSSFPAQAKPLGIGAFATGGAVLSIDIGLNQFSAAVDIYVAFIALADPGNINILNQDGNTFGPFPLSDIVDGIATGVLPAGVQKWRSNVTGPINEHLFDISFSLIPAGTYNVYVLVTPAGSLLSYYLWSTSFDSLYVQGAFYVSPDGDDNNAGTESRPWKTITKAANTLVAGDTVFIKSGTYNEQVSPRNSGSAGHYITYAAYPGETVTIDGSGISVAEYDALFSVANKHYIKVSGLRVMNVGPHGTSAGIQADGASHITIEKNYVYNTASSGILVWNSSNIVIDGNEVELANTKGAESKNECITVGETDKFEVRNNHVHHGYPVRGEGIVLKDGSSNGKAYGNHVHDVPDVGIYIDAQARHTRDIDVYQNTVHDISGEGVAISIASEAGGLLEKVGVYNNIGYNNRVYGIEISYCCMDLSTSHPVKDIKIINNTLYNNGVSWGGGIFHGNLDARNVVIRNNIVSANLSFQIALEGVDNANVAIDHNLIDGFRGFQGELRGSDFVEADPVFVNASGADFHLQAGSPAIDSGTSTNAPGSDFDGTSRPQDSGHDIGAFEF